MQNPKVTEHLSLDGENNAAHKLQKGVVYVYSINRVGGDVLVKLLQNKSLDFECVEI